MLQETATVGTKDLSAYAQSMVVGTTAPRELGSLRQADGKEGYEATVRDGPAVASVA
jgi:hypothetical protein